VAFDRFSRNIARRHFGIACDQISVEIANQYNNQAVRCKPPLGTCLVGPNRDPIKHLSHSDGIAAIFLICFGHNKIKKDPGGPLSTHRWDVNPQCISQIQQMILLLSDDATENFAQRKFSHRICLANALLVSQYGLPFIFQIESKHFFGFIRGFNLGRRVRRAPLNNRFAGQFGVHGSALLQHALPIGSQYY
jgi:hypothetical protein